MKSILTSQLFLYTIAIGLGLLSGIFANPLSFEVASFVSDLFMNLLKLISLPIIFLSIVSVASSMNNSGEITFIGKKVLKYTVITTVIAAALALTLFLSIDPVRGTIILDSVKQSATSQISEMSYWTYLLEIVPSNILEPFVKNNVIGVVFLAFIFGFGMLAVESEKRQILHSFFASLFAVFMKITSFIVRLIPIALWAFITLFVHDLNSGLELKTIGLYLLCVILSNILQAFVVLPLLLKFKQIKPLQLAKAMLPALTLAFFTKSSSATVPTAVRVAQDNAKIQPKVANFVFPLCTTINMNGCAAFILTTVLFVAQTQGVSFQPVDLILWVFIATLAAIGNAGVPMGCFFLSGALLASMNVPLTLMGVILPFYALIDAIETSINVWSDSCVAAIVDKEVTEENKAVSITQIV